MLRKKGGHGELPKTLHDYPFPCRNAPARCQGHGAKTVQEELHARVRAIFGAPELETARTLLAKVIADYEQVAPTAIATLERGFEDATAVLALPRPYRKRLRTINGQERLNE